MSFGFASNSSLKQAVRGATLGTATSSFAGVVRTDGTTLNIDVTGTISVNTSILNTVSSSLNTLSSNTAQAIQNVGTHGFAYFQPVYFNASANAGTLTVSNSTGNTAMIKIGAQFTSGATLYTITALGSGSGGNGTYTITPANTFGSAGFIITQWLWSTPANIYTGKVFVVGAGGGSGGGGGNASNGWHGISEGGGNGGSGGTGKRALKYVSLNQNTSYTITVGRKGYAGSGGAGGAMASNNQTSTGSNGTSGTSAIGNTDFGNIVSATPGTFGGAGGGAQLINNATPVATPAAPDGTAGTTSGGDFTWFGNSDAAIPLYGSVVGSAFGGGAGGGQTGIGKSANVVVQAGSAGADGLEGILIIEF